MYKEKKTRSLSCSKTNKMVEYGIGDFFPESGAIKKFQSKKLMIWEIHVEFELTIVHIDFRMRMIGNVWNEKVY